MSKPDDMKTFADPFGNLRLIEVDNAPEYYADGIAGSLLVGSNLRLDFVVVKKWVGEYVRYPMLTLVCPVASFMPQQISGLIAKAQRPQEGPDVPPWRHEFMPH